MDPGGRGCSSTHGTKKGRSENMRGDPDRQGSELISFLNKNRLFVSARGGTDERTLTHTLMDGRGGGCVSVLDRDLEAFYAAYGADVSKGRPVFVVERRSPVFKMHFDLDLTSMHTESEIDAALKTLVASVVGFLPPDSKEARCIVCAVMDAARKERRTPGLHLVFPWLQVDTERALWVRSSVLAALRKEHAGLEADWDKVVDIAVLTSNGLRMVGSDKVRDCKTCRNNREARDFCADCCRQGRLPENKVYWPWRTYPEETTADLLRAVVANAAHAAHMCSTRVPQSRALTSEFRVPEGAPPPSVRRKLSGAAARGGDGRDHALNEDDGGKIRLKSSPVELTDQLQTLLTEAFARVHPSYASLEVRQVDRLSGTRSGQAYSVKVRGFGSRFCQNKMCEHGQQTIYFIVTPAGISQRCFSRKNVVHPGGLCENYASPPVTSSGTLSRLLFGEMGVRSAGCAGGRHAVQHAGYRLSEALKCNDAMLSRASKFWTSSPPSEGAPRPRSRSARGRPAQPLLPM